MNLARELPSCGTPTRSRGLSFGYASDVDNDHMLADFHRNRRDIQGTLHTINDWAIQAVDGTEAGILLMGGRRKSETVVSSSPRAIEAHELQINMGEGPCLDVLKVDQPSTFVVGDTESDRRFPRWGPEAARLGLKSVLSAVLQTSERRFGSLNVYSDRPHVFSREDAEVIEVFSRQAARAITAVEESVGLTRALDSRKLIGQAQGILMERFKLTEDRAMAYLMRVSQDQNRKLRDVARRVVEHRGVEHRGGDES
jgi:GAF domain-containing protein